MESMMLNDEVTLIPKDKWIDSGASASRGMSQDMYDNLTRACGINGSCKPAEAMRIFKKYVPKLINSYLAMNEVLQASVKENDRIINSTTQRSGKRWTEEEDNALIEIASQEGETMMSMATRFGRSPGAVQTRLSQLVGIGRISQEIAGRFVGTIDGDYVSGAISGTVYDDGR